MSVWLDKKYLNMISPQLERFTWKSDDIANHRCPICGDSQTHKSKARGYHFVRKGGMFYKCHNCGYGSPTYKLIEHLDPNLYQQYKLERYSQGENQYSNYQKPDLTAYTTDKKPAKKQNDRSALDRLMDRLDTLPKNHHAVVYAYNRNLPSDKFDQLYYIDDVSLIKNFSPREWKNITNTHSRIVLPGYNTEGQLIGGVARAIEPDDNDMKYLSFKVKSDQRLIFGLDTMDTTEPIYVVEGPIDSLYLPNSIAMGDANLRQSEKVGVPKNNAILIYDNQPRNREIVKLIRKAVLNDFYVCLLPDDFPGKDINEAIQNGCTKEQIKQIIDQNTFHGLQARAQFNQWKKVDI